MIKRFLDIVFSLVGLSLSLPIIAVLAVWIKLDSRGPVFYRGVRSGRGGKPFLILKMRSMVLDAEKGGSNAGENDSRITRSGAFMRRAKLDELPQFINVLKGDMSFVGPRPEVEYYTSQYTEEEKAIFSVRPGITDWATLWNRNQGAFLDQFEDQDKAYEELIRPHKLQLQLFYVRNRTLGMDFKLVVFTLLRIVRPSFCPKELKDLPKLVDGRPEAADT